METGRDAKTCIVFDFETTGLSPTNGDRSIEVGAVRLEAGVVVDKFQALMNPGVRVSSFIEGYTGISNSMLEDAAASEHVMSTFANFVGEQNLVAHNASFDSRFLSAELGRSGRSISGAIACSMLVARRLFQAAPDHKLGTLVDHLSLPSSGTYHRALADAEMTAHLWLRSVQALEARGARAVTFSTMLRLSRTSKRDVDSFRV
jgi:DNA polymerase-3 subunit epsilon